MSDPILNTQSINSAQRLSFNKSYVEELVKELNNQTGNGPSLGQNVWSGFSLRRVLVTKSVCLSRFERTSFGLYRLSALSWMIRHTRLSWARLLLVNVVLIRASHGITEGILVKETHHVASHENQLTGSSIRVLILANQAKRLDMQSPRFER